MQSVNNIIPFKAEKKHPNKEPGNYFQTDLEINRAKHPASGTVEKYICLPGTKKKDTIPVPSLVLRIGARKKTFVVRYRKGGKAIKKTLPQGITIKKAVEYVARLKGGLPLPGTEPAPQHSEERTILDHLPAYYLNAVIKKGLKRPDIVQDVFIRFILPFMATTDSKLSREDYKRISALAWDQDTEALATEAHQFQPIAGIEKIQIFEEIERIQTKHGDNPARKALAYMGKFMTRASVLDKIECPTDGLSSLFTFTPSKRDRVLTRDEVPLFYKALNESQMSDYVKLAFRLLLLLGMRSGELALAAWSDVNVAKRTWTLPAENTKNGDKLTIQLPKQALELLEQLHKITGKHKMLMGGTRRDVFTKALTRIQRPRVHAEAILQLSDPITPHDLRRSFTTFMNGLGVEPYIVEKMLNHRLQGVMAHYNHAPYTDERITAAQLYADALDKPTTLPKPTED